MYPMNNNNMLVLILKNKSFKTFVMLNATNTIVIVTTI